MVEMLIALLFISLIMAGMATVFKGSITTFSATNETLYAQQRNRWTLEQLRDDVEQAGLLLPDRVLPTFITTGSESLFMINPNQTTTQVRADDANPSGTVNETITADVLEFFTDIPLPDTGTWHQDTPGDNPNPGGTATSAPASATIDFNTGSSPSDLQSGDVMVIQDSGQYGNWEHPLIKPSSGSTFTNTIAFETDPTVLANYSFTPMIPGITLAHPEGVPVYFVRPAQLVRYSVQALQLDPANSSYRVPCLVRQQTSYPTSGSVTWSSVTPQVIAENVSGFTVDMSFDGGASWIRSTAATPLTWTTMKAAADTKLASSGITGFTSMSTTPLWFRNIPCLLRIDLTTQTSTRRTEYNSTGTTRAWRYRTQVLMISPRNFGLGS